MDTSRITRTTKALIADLRRIQASHHGADDYVSGFRIAVEFALQTDTDCTYDDAAAYIDQQIAA